MATRLEHKSRITSYYNMAQPFYTLLWHRDSLGLHYGFWENEVSSRTEAILKENEILADLVGVNNGDLVLDVGSGIGGSGIWLARERGAKVIGLNLVHKQNIFARRLAHQRGVATKLGFIEGDYQQAPIRDNSVNVFWSLESIEHSTDVESLLEEAFRVLKQEGRAIIAGTFRGREFLSDEEQKQVKVGMKVAGCFNDFRTAANVGKVMQDTGFADVQMVDKTASVMESSKEMTRMCRWGLPVAKVLSAMHVTSPLLVQNNQWGLYQEGLFKSGATSYNVILAYKPS